MSNKCKKCESEDVNTTYIEKGKLINSSSHSRISDEFIRCSEYDYFYQLTSAKEHLYKHCGNCQHNWRENTADNLQVKD